MIWNVVSCRNREGMDRAARKKFANAQVAAGGKAVGGGVSAGGDGAGEERGSASSLPGGNILKQGYNRPATGLQQVDNRSTTGSQQP